jgi:hypothetical protein
LKYFSKIAATTSNESNLKGLNRENLKTVIIGKLNQQRVSIYIFPKNNFLTIKFPSSDSRLCTDARTLRFFSKFLCLMWQFWRFQNLTSIFLLC